MLADREAPGTLTNRCDDELTLPADLFIVEDGDRFLVHAPFTGGVASINRAAARRLEAVRAGTASLSDLHPALVAALAEARVALPRRLAHGRLPFPQKSEYDPDGITLFLTTKCTLACTYCYASANDRPRMMTWETAKMGLDWMFRHAQARGRDRVSVMFHGGGEVTVASELLKQCVKYARAEAASRGMTLTTSAGLNGVVAGPLLEWVLTNIDNATVSLDGLPEIHNAQRPLVTGKGSFEVIAAALHRMDEVGFPYGLRATVTRMSLPRMVESVAFMCWNFAAHVIQVEPVYPSGRAQANDLMAPDPREFVRQFRKAREIARAYGRELKYSGARFGTITNKFCQVSDDLLALTPDGAVSSCFEVGERDDPRAETFLYGRLNHGTGNLDIDNRKLIRLRSLTVEHKSSCDDCFCRWSCGGECSAKLALTGNAWDASESPRCVINRELTLDQMREYLDGTRPEESAAAI